MNKIEIAPNVFVSSWYQVSYGYRHVSGTFIIVFNNGDDIHVRGADEVEATINHWRSISEAPLNPATAKIHPDISRWLNKNQKCTKS